MILPCVGTTMPRPATLQACVLACGHLLAVNNAVGNTGGQSSYLPHPLSQDKLWHQWVTSRSLTSERDREGQPQEAYCLPSQGLMAPWEPLAYLPRHV